MPETFDFRCSECNNKYDSESLYPVVMPCGHSNICYLCALALSQCKECSAPFTYYVERTRAPVQYAKKSAAGSVRFTFPKNLTLLALMESVKYKNQSLDVGVFTVHDNKMKVGIPFDLSMKLWVGKSKTLLAIAGVVGGLIGGGSVQMGLSMLTRGHNTPSRCESRGWRASYK